MPLFFMINTGKLIEEIYFGSDKNIVKKIWFYRS